MIGPPDAVQPWMPRAARARDACLWHVSSVGGARRRGCAAAGVPGFFNGPLDGAEETDAHRVGSARALGGSEAGVGPVAARDERGRARREVADEDPAGG